MTADWFQGTSYKDSPPLASAIASKLSSVYMSNKLTDR